jgi:hypothetical protein
VSEWNTQSAGAIVPVVNTPSCLKARLIGYEAASTA